MRLAVNLVTWNAEKFLERCLKSLEAQTFRDFSLLVVDNGSTDCTVERLREKYPHIKIVIHEKNLGFAKAHNQAIHWTKCEYILCLNQDIVLAPDCLSRLIEFMDNHGHAGAAMPLLLRLQEGEKTNYVDSAGLEIFKNYKVADIAQGELHTEVYNTDEEVFGFSGACPILRRAALEDVQYDREFFDALFFSYQEDIDLSIRIRMRGWQIWRVGQAVAFHERRAREKNRSTIKDMMLHRQQKGDLVNFYSYRNHLYLLNKNFVQWAFLPNVLLYEALKFFYIFFFEIKNLRAFVDLIKNFRKLMKKRSNVMSAKRIKIAETIKWFI